jgi:hypothetical protein
MKTIVEPAAAHTSRKTRDRKNVRYRGGNLNLRTALSSALQRLAHEKIVVASLGQLTNRFHI